ncbi:MAG: YtxH domain-containing protein, partial [Candidatus Latescibacteria bacterium]|nr:YtxH domain-containing protein [Candidatus Latescibacterota bacterium]
MNNETQHSSASSIMFSFLLGGIVGAGLALLLAPQSGSETRRRITEASEDLKHKADDLAKQARSSVESAIDRGKEAFEEKKSTVVSAIDAGREAFH